MSYEGPIYYEQHGNGAEALLLIHGIMSDSSFFSGLLPFLSDRFRTVTYDRRCCGKSRSGSSRLSITEQAGDAASLLSRTDSAPAWVLGHSAGGVIALRLALDHPELVKGLILFEPAFRLSGTELPELDRWRDELLRIAETGRITGLFPAFIQAADIHPGRSASPGDAIQNVKRALSGAREFMNGEMRGLLACAFDPDELRRLTVPVVICLSSDGADNLFRSASEKAAASLGWLVETFPGCHNCIETDPEAFADRLFALPGVSGGTLR